MTDILLIAVVVLLVAVLVVQLLALRRKVGIDLSPVQQAFERTERAVREEIAKNRAEASTTASQSRQELTNTLKGVGDTLNQQLVNLTSANDQKLDAQRATINQRLGAMQDDSGKKLDQMRQEATAAAQKARQEVADALKTFNDSFVQTLKEMGGNQRLQLGNVVEQLTKLTDATEKKLDAQRATIDQRLAAMQAENGKKLEEMRATVDEKLQSTLDKRLGESFKQVSERLEQVYKGLGEMQALATGVGDLKKMLSNVKTRGTWGEVQLGAMLEQVLTPDQYATNVSPKNDGTEVEFAVKLPGKGDDPNEVVWLPIDAKFPVEDYQRLLEAQEKSDADAAEAAGKQLEIRVKACAKDICDKYLSPPKTTDFGILFLPTEGLFAEVVRRTGLAEGIQRDCRVMIAGPTTLWSLLNSLQMGFRTLAIQKRSSEVWNLLAAVKTEWSKYGEVLDKVQKKLHEASDTIEKAQTRTRVIGRKLKDVEGLAAPDAQAVLAIEADGNGDGEVEEEAKA